MGEVIRLSERRDARRRPTTGRRVRSRADFFFDLACPFTYLAAEPVERTFDEVAWRAASSEALRRSCLADDDVSAAAVRRAAEERAVALRLPLVWPERFPKSVPAAMRVAAYAAECGRGAAFVLAATRLAFCGGYDLDDPEILAEAAAAAGVVLDDTLHAARDEGRDGPIEAAGRAPQAPTSSRRSGSAARCIGARSASARRWWRHGCPAPRVCSSAGHPDGVLIAMPDVRARA
jgi:2-hydroxychromene-2-carboxylate isomerase